MIWLNQPKKRLFYVPIKITIVQDGLTGPHRKRGDGGHCKYYLDHKGQKKEVPVNWNTRQGDCTNIEDITLPFTVDNKKLNIDVNTNIHEWSFNTFHTKGLVVDGNKALLLTANLQAIHSSMESGQQGSMKDGALLVHDANFSNDVKTNILKLKKG